MGGGPPGGMDDMTMKISFAVMNDTLKMCFNDCIKSFAQPDLAQQEKLCLNNCAKRSFSTMQLLQNMQGPMAG